MLKEVAKETAFTRADKSNSTEKQTILYQTEVTIPMAEKLNPKVESCKANPLLTNILRSCG